LAAAQNKLGTMYEHGRGVQQDDVAAHMWYSLAAAQEDKAAMQHRDILAKQMTAAQIEEAEQRAREWKKAR
jgi:TPR repeat protein